MDAATFLAGVLGRCPFLKRPPSRSTGLGPQAKQSTSMLYWFGRQCFVFVRPLSRQRERYRGRESEGESEGEREIEREINITKSMFTKGDRARERERER